MDSSKGWTGQSNSRTAPQTPHPMFGVWEGHKNSGNCYHACWFVYGSSSNDEYGFLHPSVIWIISIANRVALDCWRLVAVPSRIPRNSTCSDLWHWWVIWAGTWKLDSLEWPQTWLCYLPEGMAQNFVRCFDSNVSRSSMLHRNFCIRPLHNNATCLKSLGPFAPFTGWICCFLKESKNLKSVA